MINIYPANKLENLSLLLNKVLSLGSDNIFTPDLIITQSQGMQHWINMQLAKQNGISMNVEFLLPMQFLWNQIRNVVGHENIPEKTAFSREVLSWKIFELLAKKDYVTHPAFEQPMKYWNNEGEQNQLKRYQLAVQLADLFEQYLIYRPDWIQQWEKGDIQPEHQWQALIWLALVAEDSNHVVSMIEKVSPLLGLPKHKLPSKVCIFGINVLPPIWLDFLTQLGDHIEIHLFHLNPCCEYWGDLQSEKQLAKWLTLGEVSDGFSGDLGNPLLANFGTQAREFLSMLPEQSMNEIPFFEAPVDLLSAQDKPSVLVSVQQDILQLVDARENNACSSVSRVDNSIVFASAHSVLREVQALHDYLLHQFNHDETLTPKDVIVMCPQIENYAPCIEAVFAKYWNVDSGVNTQLPYSIADRTLKNVEPIIEIFEQLLLLPDSRFQLSEIMNYLRLPAIALKFNIHERDIQTIEKWLQSACVHWGINQSHKQSVVGKSLKESDVNVSNQYTWKQGLDRLLLGFAFGDQESLYDGQLLLPTVEGEESQLLGQLMLLLEQLSEHATNLKQERTAEQWHTYLSEVKESLFEDIEEDSNGSVTLTESIDSLLEFCDASNMAECIGLPVIRDFLSNHFNQAQSNKQFMAGQITFCSMIPMRSVPFKQVCILGLNDGEFPRFDVPLSFDLIATGSARKGDRSRRSDDRYLFLEALISARDVLYLSYQGNQIKDNSVRQPSLILRELMDYLEKGYGWDFEDGLIKSTPLQAFSHKNYQGQCKSFDRNWLRLCSKNSTDRNNDIALPVIEEAKPVLSLESMIRFFDKPLSVFANQRLSLYLPDISAAYDDSEPFEVSHLDKYTIRQDYLTAELEDNDRSDVTQKALLSGRLPDNSVTVSELQNWESHAEEFAESIKALPSVCKSKAIVEYGTLTLTGDVHLNTDKTEQVIYRLTSPKPKDYITLWLNHLFAHVVTQNGVTTTGCYFQEKNKRDRVKILSFPPLAMEVVNAELLKLVAIYHQGLCAPLFVPVSLALSVFTKVDKSKVQVPMQQRAFELLWTDNNNQRCYFDDAYTRFFFNEVPDFDQSIKANIYDVYFSLFSQLNPRLVNLPTGEIVKTV